MHGFGGTLEIHGFRETLKMHALHPRTMHSEYVFFHTYLNEVPPLSILYLNELKKVPICQCGGFHEDDSERKRY